MKFFRKRRKQTDNSEAGYNLNGLRNASRHYLGYGSFARTNLSVTVTSDDNRSLCGSSFKDPEALVGSINTVATSASKRLLYALPETVLARIFSFVCPHSQDRTYDNCEDSGLNEGCMLCDLRDLAHCVQVCRQWQPVARKTLYTSIRIDTVHYCMREALLADKRKRHSFFEHNGEPEDTPDARLKLLGRTLREDPTQRLGRYVQFLKIPYMLRESRHAHIAHTVSLLPNLRYVDLPEGLFKDEAAYLALRLEVQARCPDLRKMTYMSGAERSLEAIAMGRVWQKLEVLELIKINTDLVMLRHLLSSLPYLRALKVTEMETGPHAFVDEVLAAPRTASALSCVKMGQTDGFVPNVPPLTEIVLSGTRRFKVDGLLEYLGRADAGRFLRILTLDNTGVKPWSLRRILSLAPHLRHLTVVDRMSDPLPTAAGTKSIQLLSASSLKTINYEITPAQGVSPHAGVTRSYYSYLCESILSGGLPNLRAVYVRDAQFLHSLLGDLPLPGRIGSAGSAGAYNRRPASVSTRSASVSASAHSPSFLAGASVLRANQALASSMSSPEQWLQPPASVCNTKKSWTSDSEPRYSSNKRSASSISLQQVQTLEVFTKSDDDLDWSSIIVASGGRDQNRLGGCNSSSSRPVSCYGLGADLGAVGARKSVLVNIGAGQFLAVSDAVSGAGPTGAGNAGSSGNDNSSLGGRPSHGLSDGHRFGPDLWPRSASTGERRSEKMDLWR
ncbi:hypothetical protein SEPCBS57363_004482 [Sporothrix epigloea]|uniref:F-box domain-containing protein n=1 Tax=Sporothrix epigloea TaxID=1892477 RepID=A0ABP0DS90_9PEZI